MKSWSVLLTCLPPKFDTTTKHAYPIIVQWNFFQNSFTPRINLLFPWPTLDHGECGVGSYLKLSTHTNATGIKFAQASQVVLQTSAAFCTGNRRVTYFIEKYLEFPTICRNLYCNRSPLYVYIWASKSRHKTKTPFFQYVGRRRLAHLGRYYWEAHRWRGCQCKPCCRSDKVQNIWS